VPRSVDLLFFGGGDGGVAGDVSHFTLRLRDSKFFCSFDDLFFVLVVFYTGFSSYCYF
jgi:hypothetical protein